jgi:hypothetical protein
MGRKVALVIGNSEYDDASLALVQISLGCLYKDCPSPVAGSVTQTDVLLSAGYVFILRHGSLMCSHSKITYMIPSCIMTMPRNSNAQISPTRTNCVTLSATDKVVTIPLSATDKPSKKESILKEEFRLASAIPFLVQVYREVTVFMSHNGL